MNSEDEEKYITDSAKNLLKDMHARLWEKKLVSLSRIILVCLTSFLFISCQSHVHNNGLHNNVAEYVESAPVKFCCRLPSCNYVFDVSFESSIGNTSIGVLILTVKNIKNLISISTSVFEDFVDKFPSSVFKDLVDKFSSSGLEGLVDKFSSSGLEVLANGTAAKFFSSPSFTFLGSVFDGFSELVVSAISTAIPTVISASAVALFLTVYHWCYMKVWYDETKCQAQK